MCHTFIALYVSNFITLCHYKILQSRNDLVTHFYSIDPKQKQLAHHVPPTANNSRTFCEAASECRWRACNGRRNHCMWHCLNTSGLCRWNLSFDMWRDIYQGRWLFYWVPVLFVLVLEGLTGERSCNHGDERTVECHLMMSYWNSSGGNVPSFCSFDHKANLF